MSDPFDPYYTWLGIPPPEQPPNHYRLLGLAAFETNPDVISNAADRQMLLLRTFQTGPHSALSQRLLNEVAAAKVCLLNPEKKAAYDERLHGHLGAGAGKAAGPVSGEPVVPPPVPSRVAAPPVAGEEPGQRLREAEGSELQDEAVAAFDFEPASTASASQTARLRRQRVRRRSLALLGGLALGVFGVLAVALLVVMRRPASTARLQLQPIAPVTVGEGEPVTLTVRVEDADAWQGRVSYHLGPDAPDGARIDPQAGQFTWKAAAAGRHRVTVCAEASDPKAVDEQILQIEVIAKTEVAGGRAPALAPIPEQTVELGGELTVSVEVEDPGEPAADVRFRLGAGAPAEMRIGPESGVITWRPGESVSPGELRVTVAAVSEGPGNPKAEQSFSIRVTPKGEVRGPALAPIGEQVVEAGKDFSITVLVEDYGEPRAELTFSLRAGAPEGMEIDERLGRITWSPGEDQRPGKYVVTVAATSGGATEPSDEKMFTIEVKPSPATGTKHPVPEETSQAEVLAKVKGAFQGEYRNTKPYARLALAARLIREARQSDRPAVERYVMLREAERLAVQLGDCLVGLAAAEELGRQFELDAVGLKLAVLEQVARQARGPAAAVLLADATLALAREASDAESIDSVSALCRQLKAMARKLGGPRYAERLEREQELLAERKQVWELSQTAAATLELNPDEPEANFRMGKVHALVEHDWREAFPLLAKGGDDKLREAAGQLVTEPTDLGAQLALADAWWDLAEKESGGAKLLFRQAARHWYQQALPGVTAEDMARVQARLEGDEVGQDEGKRPAFALRLRGVGGTSAVGPPKATGEVAPVGGFASFRGKGSLQYARLPTCSYVHEFELTLNAPAGSVNLTYGDAREGCKITFNWDGDARKFLCGLFWHGRHWTYWRGSRRHFDAGAPLRFTLYVNEDRQTLYHSDSRIMSAVAGPADLVFSISTGDKTMAVLSRCEFRPWTEADARRIRCSMPPTRIDCHPSETAVQLHERNLGLADRPSLNEGKPFLVTTTGTPMVWVDPGTFKRRGAKQPSQETEVAISRGFWIGRYEITQAEWAAGTGASVGRVTGSPFLPADGVSWEHAMKFCELVHQRESRSRRVPKGYQYRLPTEAEWEYACRAGSEEDFSVEPGGFWSAQNSGWRPHEVGEGQANAWGLYDMHGNVREWCYDAWEEAAEAPVVQVRDPLVLPKGLDGEFVVRGGAWWTRPDACTSHARTSHRSVAGGHRGFRLVLGPGIGGG